MQLGIFTVGDITTDPATDKTPNEHQRIKNTVEMTVLAEQAGLGFFAIGEYHSPPFAPPPPMTLLANITTRTDKLLLSTATTFITADGPVRLAKKYAYLQHLSDGCIDLMMGYGNTGPVYPRFGKDIRESTSLTMKNYDLLRRLWRETNVDWEDELRAALQDFTSIPHPLDGVSPFVWYASIRSLQIAEQATYYGDGHLHNSIFWPIDHVKKMVGLYRECFAFYGCSRPEQTIMGLGGQIFIARSEAEAIERYTPYFHDTYVYQGASLEEMIQHTPLAVDTPEQIVEKCLTYRDAIGDYQRQASNLDPGGVPHKETMERIEYLGSEIVPAPRAELESTRPEGVPGAPFHPHHRALLEGTELPAEEPFPLSNELDPLMGREVKIRDGMGNPRHGERQAGDG